MKYTIFEYFAFIFILISLIYLIFLIITNYKAILKFFLNFPFYTIIEILLLPLFLTGLVFRLFNKGKITNSDSHLAIDHKVLKVKTVNDNNFKKKILFSTDNFSKVQNSVEECIKIIPRDFKDFKYKFIRKNSNIILDPENSTLYQFHFILLCTQDKLKNTTIVGFAKNIYNEKESYFVIYDDSKIDVNLLLAKNFKNELLIIDVYKSTEQQIIEYKNNLDIDIQIYKKHFTPFTTY